MTATDTGTLSTALAHAERLLATNPAAAEAQTREILKAVPGHPQAELLLGAARRIQGDPAGARDILEPLALQQPKAAVVRLELGLALAGLGEGPQALKAIAKAMSLSPKFPDAWRVLGDELTSAGESDAANEAYARHIKAGAKDPQLLAAATALIDGRLPIAERGLRDFLKAHPTDVAAIRMLAEIAARLRRYEDAETLLVRALELAPGFATARHNYASILYRHNKPQEVITQIDLLLESQPRHSGYLALKGAALGQLGEYERAGDLFRDLLREVPRHPKIWMSYGHTLKTLGKTAQAIEAYRKSIALLPSLGEAYWSLANLKTFRFTAEDVAAMRAQLQRGSLQGEDRYHFAFAMAKALEDEGEYAQSFAHYEKANALRLESAPYDAKNTSGRMRRSRAVFTPSFFAERKGSGAQAPDPIFVVGLPRAGSTLIEQILSSHSLVEGTMELHDISNMARELRLPGAGAVQSSYPEVLAALDADRLRELGERYLAQTRIYRKSDRPFFVDKMPNNFVYAGFIHLILPNAKIIDARRHPIGCCLSCFKQHFARGQTFSYSLHDLGRYYADYVELMAHYDIVMPGRIHRVLYENMVDNPEAEVRRLLDYCGLPFEEACLRFYENPRAVRTASSEQVRQPIFREGVEQWLHFEPWLMPLKEALGPVLDAYPSVPATFSSQ